DRVKIFVNNMLQNLYNEIDTGGGFKEQNYILNLRQGLNDLKIIFKGENITINKSSFNHIDVRKIDGYKDLGFNVILDNGRDDIFTLQETENKDINLSIKSGVNIETLNNYFTNNSGKIKIICYPIDNNGIGKEITWNKSKDGRETIGVMITGPQVFVQNINGNGYEPESITLK
ncbi:MAG: hypothetical protein N2053_13350, partial [Chitinispirillaceae bacterium]|nr:hypothetical protein [Chitinispirillaceae bacterium]